MKIKKRYAYTLIGLLILIVGIFVAYALATATGGGHSSDEIIVSIGGCYVTLQDAITNDYFTKNLASFTPTTCLSTFPSVYHTADEILIIINSHTMTLQQAVDNNVFFNGATQDYTNQLPEVGHFATEIEVDIGGKQTLQDAITNDAGAKFSYTCVPDTCASLNYNCGSPSDGCGGTLDCGTCSTGVCTNNVCTGVCTPGATKTIECDNLDTACKDYHDVVATCTSYGEWINDWCNTWLSIKRGTSCNADGTYTCDGAGTCEGYSGTGCASCPWGSTAAGSNNYVHNRCIVPDETYSSMCELIDGGSSDCDGGWYCSNGGWDVPCDGAYLDCWWIFCNYVSTDYSWHIKPR